MQETIFTGPPNDLSVYRLKLNRIWHVAVLGQTPPPELDRRLTRILAAGDAATLPPDVMQALAQRRAEQIRRGPWTEGHYRPGRPL